MWDEDDLQVEKDFLEEKTSTSTITGYISSFFTGSPNSEAKEKKLQQEPEEVIVEKSYNSPNISKNQKKLFSDSKQKPKPGSLSREKNENATIKVHGAKYSFPVYNSDSPGPTIETPTPLSIKSNIKFF